MLLRRTNGSSSRFGVFLSLFGRQHPAGGIFFVAAGGPNVAEHPVLCQDLLVGPHTFHPRLSIARSRTEGSRNIVPGYEVDRQFDPGSLVERATKVCKMLRVLGGVVDFVQQGHLEHGVPEPLATTPQGCQEAVSQFFHAVLGGGDQLLADFVSARMNTPGQNYRCLGQFSKDTGVGRDGRDGDPSRCQLEQVAIGHHRCRLDDGGCVVGGLPHSHKDAVVDRINRGAGSGTVVLVLVFVLLLIGKKALYLVGPVHLRQYLGRRQTPEFPHAARRAKGASLPATDLRGYAQGRFSSVIPRDDHCFDLEAVFHQLQQELRGPVRGNRNLREFCDFFFDPVSTDRFQEPQGLFAEVAGRSLSAGHRQAFLDLLAGPSLQRGTRIFFGGVFV
mmetsp:Transcript_26513/g.56815  ORF Transcript_26513/g.56815 Transcript_26513/m.56815 type:complete len:389 (-) Transcript_26513:410-1576(-)